MQKSTLRGELVETIRSVYAGSHEFQQTQPWRWRSTPNDEWMTPRELTVLTRVSEGHSNKLIADKLMISEHTVKNHLKNILSKLNASDRTHAVTIALKRGFFHL